MIQIRDVPDDLHRELKRRAGKKALTLSDYLKQELARIAERPSLDEWLERVREHEPIKRLSVPIEDIIREDRGSH
jgi:hypothetical protein